MMEMFIRKLKENNRGVTLLEAVIAILLISITSVAVTSLYFSLSRLARMSDTQIKINTVMRIVKENVCKSVIKGDKIHGTTVEATAAKTAPGNTLENLTIKDINDHIYPYVFDLTFDSTAHGIQKYWITIRKSSGGELATKFSIEVFEETGAP